MVMYVKIQRIIPLEGVSTFSNPCGLIGQRSNECRQLASHRGVLKQPPGTNNSSRLAYRVKMTRWLVRLLSQEAGKWSGTSINSGIRTVGQ
jgi:hypothetical protein